MARLAVGALGIAACRDPAPSAPSAPSAARPSVEVVAIEVPASAPAAAPDPPPVALSVVASSAPAFERRCGWVDNPTPANWSITDRDGEWLIGVQGGYQAQGDMPDFGADWVEQNGHYGYGCACLEARFDPAAKQVLEIRSAKKLAISRCRADKRLPRR